MRKGSDASERVLRLWCSSGAASPFSVVSSFPCFVWHPVRRRKWTSRRIVVRQGSYVAEAKGLSECPGGVHKPYGGEPPDVVIKHVLRMRRLEEMIE